MSKLSNKHLVEKAEAGILDIKAFAASDGYYINSFSARWHAIEASTAHARNNITDKGESANSRARIMAQISSYVRRERRTLNEWKVPLLPLLLMKSPPALEEAMLWVSRDAKYRQESGKTTESAQYAFALIIATHRAHEDPDGYRNVVAAILFEEMRRPMKKISLAYDMIRKMQYPGTKKSVSTQLRDVFMKHSMFKKKTFYSAAVLFLQHFDIEPIGSSYYSALYLNTCDTKHDIAEKAAIEDLADTPEAQKHHLSKVNITSHFVGLLDNSVMRYVFFNKPEPEPLVDDTFYWKDYTPHVMFSEWPAEEKAVRVEERYDSSDGESAEESSDSAQYFSDARLPADDVVVLFSEQAVHEKVEHTIIGEEDDDLDEDDFV